MEELKDGATALPAIFDWSQPSGCVGTVRGGSVEVYCCSRMQADSFSLAGPLLQPSLTQVVFVIEAQFFEARACNVCQLQFGPVAAMRRDQAFHVYGFSRLPIIHRGSACVVAKSFSLAFTISYHNITSISCLLLFLFESYAEYDRLFISPPSHATTVK